MSWPCRQTPVREAVFCSTDANLGGNKYPTRVYRPAPYCTSALGACHVSVRRYQQLEIAMSSSWDGSSLDTTAIKSSARKKKTKPREGRKKGSFFEGRKTADDVLTIDDSVSRRAWRIPARGCCVEDSRFPGGVRALAAACRVRGATGLLGKSLQLLGRVAIKAIAPALLRSNSAGRRRV